MKVGFLFNHDALHQIGHTAPIIAQIATFPQVEVHVLTSSAEQEARVRALIGAEAADRVTFVPLDIGMFARALDAGLRWIAPFRRVAVLRENLSAFAALDVLVVPETTSLLLRDRFGLTGLRYVWLPHGAGDRSVGYRGVMRGFDLVLLSGRKVHDRMQAMGLITPGQARIIGYPKFDTIDSAAPPEPLFDNGRPTVLYNPHFEPRLSSWYDMGEGVLDWFAGQDRFNLMVAPHVMLFRRRVHASVEHARLRWRRNLAHRYRDCPHIRFDTGSTASVDMTYTRAADIYLGDVSSQIYEWIARPRPAVFLNPAQVDWAADPNFAHWHLGRVVDDIAALGPAIDHAGAEFAHYRPAQEAAFHHTFDQGAEPAALRAARAIVERFG
ncbi:hypothetical protein [Sphingomonas sp.]|uniref:hypothetical protein n=1 Tax=Sphingomonas sp. TaxID=28214 RepID=UPI0035AF627A